MKNIVFDGISIQGRSIVWDYNPDTKQATCLFQTLNGSFPYTYEMMKPVLSRYPGITCSDETKTILVSNTDAFSVDYPLIFTDASVSHTAEPSGSASSHATMLGTLRKKSSSDPSLGASPKKGDSPIPSPDTSAGSLSPRGVQSTPAGRTLHIRNLICSERYTADVNVWGNTLCYEDHFLKRLADPKVAEKEHGPVMSHQALTALLQREKGMEIYPLKSSIIRKLQVLFDDTLAPLWAKYCPQDTLDKSPHIVDYFQRAIALALSSSSRSHEQTSIERMSPEELSQLMCASVARRGEAIRDEREFDAQKMLNPLYALINKNRVIPLSDRAGLSEREAMESFRESLLTDPTCGYDFALMSSLPEGDKNQAETNIIYLSRAGEYVVRDPDGHVQTGHFHMTFQDDNLLKADFEDAQFVADILAQTTRNGHTRTVKVTAEISNALNSIKNLVTETNVLEHKWHYARLKLESQMRDSEPEIYGYHSFRFCLHVCLAEALREKHEKQSKIPLIITETLNACIKTINKNRSGTFTLPSALREQDDFYLSRDWMLELQNACHNHFSEWTHKKSKKGKLKQEFRSDWIASFTQGVTEFFARQIATHSRAPQMPEHSTSPGTNPGSVSFRLPPISATHGDSTASGSNSTPSPRKSPPVSGSWPFLTPRAETGQSSPGTLATGAPPLPPRKHGSGTPRPSATPSAIPPPGQ